MRVVALVSDSQPTDLVAAPGRLLSADVLPDCHHGMI